MQKKIQHEIKLEKSVKVILGILAVGLLVNAFNPQDFGIKEALAELSGGYSFEPFHMKLDCSGCN